MTRVPVFSARHVELAVSPGEAVEAVRDGFVAHFHGDWTMPPKVYVTNYPAGDFRAMPALGGAHALLKWVTSFPGNPARGLPTVAGIVLLSDAETGELRALMEAGAVTALRTGAAAVLAAETLGRSDASTAAVIGAGVNGRAAARTFLARGRAVSIWDVDQARARAAAAELGAGVAGSLQEALAADLLVTMTPGHEVLLGDGSLAPGQHVSLMGADGPGKAEISATELARTRKFCDDWEQVVTDLIPKPRMRLFCDEWEQASHSGDLFHAVEAGLIDRSDVTQLGAVLAGDAPGRQSPKDITVFDSTGLAIQDMAIALACMERADELDLPTLAF
ncbi:MAG TPA: ornithine cyclodeaminase family protein [Gaiellaceae bacterium]|nr:ornithine cyclodeaminase family protein [Gaiellaceae bacterium]